MENPDLTPPDVELPDVDPDDLRVGHLLATPAGGAEDGAAGDLAAVIVGFPSDAGVVINGGRAGAAGGPQALRQRLYRLTPDARAAERFGVALSRTADLGDVRVSGDVEADQEALAAAIAPHLAAGTIPVILGGGHETAFGHFLGHVRAGIDVAVLNWDAHPDVRLLKNGRGHSGSPFRQMLTHASGGCRGYTVAGLLPHQVSRAHVDWIQERGGRIVWRDDVDNSAVEELYRSLQRPTMVSFDLDAVDQASAPGVSAPATGGIDSHTWLIAAYEAGRSRAVVSMDVVELNPKYDPDGRTARLAALTVWMFLRGLGERITG